MTKRTGQRKAWACCREIYGTTDRYTAIHSFVSFSHCCFVASTFIIMSRLPRHNTNGDDTSSVYSGVSITSSYRHHNTGPFMPVPASPPQPVLIADRKHVPKTTGSTGIMVIGLGGANGTTLLAGILANRMNMTWHGPRGEPMLCNYYGCITQLDQKGGGVGYRNRVKLANVSMAAVGGWVRWKIKCIDHDVASPFRVGHSTDQTRRRLVARPNSRLRSSPPVASRNE